MVFLENPTNPLLKVVDINKISQISKSHNSVI